MIRKEVNPWIHPIAGDDARFLATVERILDASDEGDIRANHVFVIRIKNWFDDKWLGFSGIGRVAFDFPRASHPQVAMDGIRQDKVTFPPFTPNRVLSEHEWTLDGETPDDRRIHRRRLEHSALNLQRRVADFSKSLSVFWISTHSESNGRASMMSYRAYDDRVDTWYAGFRRELTWKVDRVKGISRERVVSMIGEKAA